MSFVILSLNQNDLIVDIFLANFKQFQNSHKKHISWNLFLLKQEILDLQRFFWNCGTFRTSFFSWPNQGMFSPVVCCRLVQFYQKGTPLHTFFKILTKAFDAAIPKYPHGNIYLWWNLIEFWAVVLVLVRVLRFN